MKGGSRVASEQWDPEKPSQNLKGEKKMAEKKTTPVKNGNADSIALDGNVLSMSLKIDPKGRPSASGKSMIHFTTSGYKEVPGTSYRVSLTVIGPKS